VHRTSITVSYDSVHTASIVEQSVGPEIGDIDGARSSATIDRAGSAVTVDVEATDLVALRAGQNTWLSLLEVAERVTDGAPDR